MKNTMIHVRVLYVYIRTYVYKTFLYFLVFRKYYDPVTVYCRTLKIRMV